MESFYAGKTILLTGGTGFIGKVLHSMEDAVLFFIFIGSCRETTAGYSEYSPGLLLEYGTYLNPSVDHTYR